MPVGRLKYTLFFITSLNLIFMCVLFTLVVPILVLDSWAEPLTVSADKPNYIDGDTIFITGQVVERLSEVPVTIRVVAPNNNLVYVAQADVGLDGNFSTELVAGGSAMKFEGTYTIHVFYGTAARITTTTFEFGVASDSLITTDPLIINANAKDSINVFNTTFDVRYTITNAELISIEPDTQSSSLRLLIVVKNDGQLIITLPRGLINSNDTFFVIIDGNQVSFEQIDTSTGRVLIIPFKVGDQEIEIVGTFVVPEFSIVQVLLFTGMVTTILVVKSKLGVINIR